MCGRAGRGEWGDGGGVRERPLAVGGSVLSSDPIFTKGLLDYILYHRQLSLSNK